MIRSILVGSIVGVSAFSFFAFSLRVQAQDVVAADPAAAERDLRRVEDLLRIKEAVDLYATYYWSYPRYSIQSPAMSDDYWRRNVISRDFRKRLKNFINQLPVDPLNNAVLNFRYVYGYVPLNNEDVPDCAGKIILFAARVETDPAHYQECDLGGTQKRILYVIMSEKKNAVRDVLAGVFAPFVKLLSLNF